MCSWHVCMSSSVCMYSECICAGYCVNSSTLLFRTVHYPMTFEVGYVSECLALTQDSHVQAVCLRRKDAFLAVQHNALPSIHNMLCYLEDEKKWRALLCVCLAVKSHFWFSQLITLHHSLFVCLLHRFQYLIWGNNEAETVFAFNGTFAVPNRF